MSTPWLARAIRHPRACAVPELRGSAEGGTERCRLAAAGDTAPLVPPGS